MKILWFVPTIFPAVCQHLGLYSNEGGWWVECLFNSLIRNTDIEFGIVCMSPDFKQVEDFIYNGVHYYCVSSIPMNWRKVPQKIRRLFELSVFDPTSKLLNILCDVATDFQPNMILIHGSETLYGLISERSIVPVLLSIQGILSEYVKVYFGKLTLYQRLIDPKLVYGYLSMLRRAKREKRIFRSTKFFFGRTLWDRNTLAKLNPEGRYFYESRLIRPEFYNVRWRFEGIISYSLYTTTSCLPYKGIDILINAVSILKNIFPAVRLRIGGTIPHHGYGNYLRKKVEKLGLDDSVNFLGRLSAERIAEELAQAHTFILPSFIENSPNSLAEAQLVGTPVVASSAGGIPSLVSNGETGLLFPPGDVAVLALQIGRMFEGNDLALQCSEQARQAAFARHDETTVVASFINALDVINQSTAWKQDEK